MISRGEPAHVFTIDSLLPDAATVELITAVDADADGVVVEVFPFSAGDEVSLDVMEDDEHDASNDAHKRTINGRREAVFLIDTFGGGAICS